jgi:streptogramin lyase
MAARAPTSTSARPRPGEADAGVAPSNPSSAATKVWEVDDECGILVKTFPAGENPLQIGFADDALWVTNVVDGVVRRIHPRSGEVVRVVDVGHSPIGIAVAGGRLYVTVSEP